MTRGMGTSVGDRTRGTLIVLTLLLLVTGDVGVAQDRNLGILGREAPEWDIDWWIDGDGEPTDIRLRDYRGKVVYLMCFQSWCPGCHSVGFPTLQALVKEYEDNDDVVFVAVQTVFEGFTTNSRDKVRDTQKRYKLDIPMGHDPGSHSPQTWPNVMFNYRSGGTPWVVVIDRKGVVRYNDFHIRPEQAVRLINGLL